MPQCPYCGRPLEKTRGGRLFPGNTQLSQRIYFVCFPCEAWVGCHPGTDHPMGTAAKEKLRALRSRTHKIFDLLWCHGSRRNRGDQRREAYRWLATQFGRAEIHIGEMDEDQCKKAITLAKKRLREGTLPVEDT